MTQETALTKKLSNVATSFQLDQPHVQVAVFTFGHLSLIFLNFENFYVEFKILDTGLDIIHVKSRTESSQNYIDGAIFVRCIGMVVNFHVCDGSCDQVIIFSGAQFNVTAS